MISEEFLRQQCIRERCVHPSGRWVEFQPADFAQSIATLFEAQATQSAHRCAVKTSRRELSYTDLNRFANQIARTTLAASNAPLATIALCFEIGASLVAAMVATIKLGKCHVVLDPHAPQERNSYILNDAQVNVILTDQESLAQATLYADAARLILNVDAIDPYTSAENLGLAIPPDQIIRLIYTSGSTGQPKGVSHLQQNLLYELLRISNVVHLSAEDRQLLHSRNGFGATFRSLLSGATVYPFDLKREGFVTLAHWLAQEEITILQTVPTVMHHFTNALNGSYAFPHLRLVILSGEALYRPQAVQAVNRFPSAILMNTLGSQESYYYRAYFIDQNTPLPDERVAVGYALPGSEVLLVDEAGHPVAQGEIGEIVVKSRYLSGGYWRRPELTAARFVNDPADGAARRFFTGDLGQLLPDGQLLYGGRKDFQVKVRGFQVDINEVEKALHNLAGVNAAAVVVSEEPSGATRLIAYIAADAAVTASSLRRQLTPILPNYMIPSIFVILETLPMTAMGKINRQGLPRPTSARQRLASPFVAPRTSTEMKIAQIWAEVLGVDAIGVDDNFLELGGHSLQASQIISRVLDLFQIELPSSVLFEAATVASMAEGLFHFQLQQLPIDEVDKLLGDLETMSEAEVHQRLNEPGDLVS